MVREDGEVFEFQIRAQDLHRPNDSQALPFTGGIVTLRGGETATPETDGVSDPFVIGLE